MVSRSDDGKLTIDPVFLFYTKLAMGSLAINISSHFPLLLRVSMSLRMTPNDLVASERILRKFSWLLNAKC